MRLTNLAFSNKPNSRLGQLLSGALFNAYSSVFNYRANSLYPEYTLDFESGKYYSDSKATTLISAATHTRASSATYVDSGGILQTAAIDVPRVGHHLWNGTAWVDAGYLHESEARTNLLEHSIPDATNWTSSSVTITDGTSLLGLDSAEITSSSATGAASLTASANNSSTYTFWVLVKAGTLSSVTMRAGLSGNYVECEFDISAGTAGSVVVAGTGVSQGALIREFAQGIFLCSVSGSGIGSGSLSNQAIYPGGSSSGTGSILIYGAQFEAGSTPSSYIPTDGSTVTRAADVMTIPAANLPWPTEAPLAVSIQMSGTMTYADEGIGAQVIYNLWQKDGNNLIRQSLLTLDDTTGNPHFIQRALGLNDALLAGSTYSPGVNVPFNIASRHGSTFLNGAIDGTALTADLTPTALPDLENTDMQIATAFNGTIDLFRVWKVDITDEGIAEAST